MQLTRKMQIYTNPSVSNNYNLKNNFSHIIKTESLSFSNKNKKTFLLILIIPYIPMYYKNMIHT